MRGAPRLTIAHAEALPRTRRPLPPSIDTRRLAERVGHALWHWAPPLATGLAAAIPVIASTVKAIQVGWVPSGDDGIIATRGWDVLTSHTPNIGQYSEAGLVVHGQVMHSPGPMLYWLIALPAHFGSVTSIAATMGIANTLAIIGAVALARRRGGVVLMFAAAVGIALMCQSLPSESFHDIWNPAAGLFPFLLLIFIGWSLACGEHRLLPLAALVASFVTQTHLMYAAPTAVVLSVGLGGLALSRLERRRRGRHAHHHHEDERRRIWPWLLAALAVAAACWTPPVIDEIENNPGNLTMIVNTVEHRGATLGSTVGWNAVVHSIGVTPWWLYVPRSEWERKYDVGALVRPGQSAAARPSGAMVASAIVILVALGLVAVLAAFALRFDLMAAALIGLGMCAAIGIEAAGEPATPLLAGTLGYTMWWGSELGFWVWMTLAWALWVGAGAATHAWRRRLRGRLATAPGWRGRVLAAVALASLAGLGGTVAVGEAVASTGRPDSHHLQYQPTRALAAGIDRVIPPGVTVGYSTRGLDQGTQPIEPSVRFFLVRHGDLPLANGSFKRMGAYYELGDRPVQWRLRLVQGVRRVRHMHLAARIRFRDGFGHEVLSAWVRRVG